MTALVATLLCVLNAAPKPAVADVLTAEVATSSPPTRSGAPITVVWKLKSQLTSVQEGYLEVVVRDGDETLARIRSDETAIGLGEQLYRMVLPALETHNPFGAVDMHLRLVGPKQTFDFGAFPLRLSSPWQRNFVVAVCDAWEAAPSEAKQGILQRFRFESFNPETNDRTVTTNLSSVVPESLPPDPLMLCGYDVVILVGRGIAELKEPQLEALSTWVAAGGSLCVIPDGQSIKIQHLDFIEKLCCRAKGTRLGLDGRGRIVTPNADLDSDPAPGMIRHRRFGLGRTALILSPFNAMTPASDPDFRAALASLWKLRKDQVPKFVETGKWRDDAMTAPRPAEVNYPQTQEVVFDANGQPIVVNNPYNAIRPRDMSLAPVPLQTGDQLLSRLMPRDLKVVPLKLIGLVLFLYILVIGPVDYFLLGAIRRRRWTWVLFPAVSIGFALGTIAVSNWYMRFHDDRRSITVVDLGDDGAVVRTNRFETLFRSVPSDESTEVARGFMTAMNHQKFSRGTWYAYQQASTRGTEDQLDLVGIPVYSGRMPAKYQVLQSLPQWTPQLNRLLQMSVGPDPPKFDWDLPARFAVVDSNAVAAVEARQQLGKAITGALGSECSAFVVTGKHIHQIAGSAQILGPQDPQVVSTTGYTSYPNQFYNQRSETASFLQDICTAEALGGLFGVASQLSPNGGKDFEDLALLDPSDAAQWILIVAIQQEDDLVVFRKLYTGERE